jgi:hypothetical protein
MIASPREGIAICHDKAENDSSSRESVMSLWSVGTTTASGPEASTRATATSASESTAPEYDVGKRRGAEAIAPRKRLTTPATTPGVDSAPTQTRVPDKVEMERSPETRRVRQRPLPLEQDVRLRREDTVCDAFERRGQIIASILGEVWDRLEEESFDSDSSFERRIGLSP